MTTKVKDEISEASVTRWHESLVGIDLLLLHTSPVFYGASVPHGDGSAVIMIPGFMHSDIYLVVMYAWLSRIGYCPYYSGIDLNAECPDLLIKSQLCELLNSAMKETGGKVHLIGHSLGGIIARSLASQRPRQVASVITLGSPFRGALLHPDILRETEVVRRFIQQQHGVNVPPECYTEHCKCAFVKALGRGIPKSMAQTSIYTRDDGVLDWRACKTGRREVDVEVHGTHAGLAFNPEVYSIIAERLAKPRRAKRKAVVLSAS